MATSETDICNLALSRLGRQLITSLTEGTTAADRCVLHYPLSRDTVLRAHPWNFAVRRVTLALSATTPNHEFTYQHALPTDCLKVVRTSWDADGLSIEHRIEGRFILCNETTVKIEYIARMTDVAQFDELFVDVLAQRLAAEMCMVFTDNQSLTRSLLEVYAAKLDEARGVDAQEGTPREIVDVSSWLVARY